MAGGYELLPHTADVLIRAWGDTLEEAFAYGALGMYEVMTDIKRIEPREERSVESEGFDLENLLYNWIEDLITLFDVESFLASKVVVEKIWETGDGWRLKAKLWGEPFDPERHESRALVKAATYHLMKIWEEGGKHYLQFVVDI